MVKEHPTLGLLSYQFTRERQFGGDVYRHMVADVMGARFDIYLENVDPWFSRAKRPQQVIRTRLLEPRTDVDIWIRETPAIAAMRTKSKRSKNIALIYHIDGSDSPHRWFQSLFLRLVLRKARSCDATVVIAEYWKRFLENRGVHPVEVIHNGFDVPMILSSLRDIDNFREKQGLGARPIVYIGNARQCKGTRGVYEALKHLDVELVTSGMKDVDIPVRHLQLSYADYLKLLAVSEVVITMSTFCEGWNRTAHEAMLCHTPVIGSGTGGMRELLEGGGQLICETLESLPAAVQHAITHHAELGDSGFRYARQFTVERFADSWMALIARLQHGRKS